MKLLTTLAYFVYTQRLVGLANQVGRTEKTSTALSMTSSQSERFCTEPRRQAWLPHAMWGQTGDTTLYNQPHRPATHNGVQDTDRTNSTYDSHHCTKVNQSEASTRNVGPELIRFDRWINRQPIAELTNRQPVGELTNRQPIGELTNRLPIGELTNRQAIGELTNRQPIGELTNRQPIAELTNRPHLYNTTQLIRQTQPEEKKIVWIYSFKNHHILSEDDCRDDSETPNTTESDKSDYHRSEENRLCTIKPESDKITNGCDSWSCYDTKLKGSPRFPNTCMPVYIPSLKLARFSLETLHEGVETEESETRPTDTLMNPHISAKTLQSVNQWIDGSKQDDRSTSSKLNFYAATQRTTNIVRDNEMDVVYKLQGKGKPHRLDIGSLAEINEKIETKDWITNETCIDVNSKPIWQPRNSEKRIQEWGPIRVVSTVCPDGYASARLHARAMGALEGSPWDVYYAAVEPRASKVLEISLNSSKTSRRERTWSSLSSSLCKWSSLSCSLCKCFGCRK